MRYWAKHWRWITHALEELTVEQTDKQGFHYSMTTVEIEMGRHVWWGWWNPEYGSVSGSHSSTHLICIWKLRHSSLHFNTSNEKASLVAQLVKNLPAMRETRVQFLGREDPLEGRAWQPTPVFLPRESPWTEEPGRLQSLGSQSQTWLND